MCAKVVNEKQHVDMKYDCGYRRFFYRSRGFTPETGIASDLILWASPDGTKILTDAPLARDRRNVRWVTFSFPMISFAKLGRHKSKVQTVGRQKIRACWEWNPKKRREIEGSISANRISMHRVFNRNFVRANGRIVKNVKSESTPLKNTRPRTELLLNI